MITITPLASSSKGNCMSLSDGKTRILLDAGITVKRLQKALGFRTSSVAGVLISHEHQDHCKAVKGLIRVGVDCYMSKGTGEALNIENNEHKFVSVGRQFSIGSWKILPFDALHDAAEPLAFLLASGENKVLFATDTAFIKPRFKGLTHIIIECNNCAEILRENVRNGTVNAALKSRIMRNHMSMENVIEFLKANDLNKVQEIHLIHLSDANSSEEIMKREVQTATGKPTFVAVA